MRADEYSKDLEEDRATLWLPDALGEGDLLPSLASPALASLPSALVVPRASLDSRIVLPLDFRALGYLHSATRQIAHAAEARLLPTVCGYRTGATAGESYRTEVQRFSEITNAFASTYEYIVVADVFRFFEQIDLVVFAEILQNWDPVNADSVMAALRFWESAGFRGLPPGYADMRLLANLFLHAVDEHIDVPFTRYVDDFRLFASTQSEGEEVLDRVGVALSKVGLSLNLSKSSVVPTSEYLSHGSRPLTSVFHPDKETAEQTSWALREVFLGAVAMDRINRRDLRFVLPRLRAVGDDFAVSYCQAALRSSPWEAPRMIDYLSRFLERDEVRSWFNELAVESVDTLDHWMLGRVSPALCRYQLDSVVSERLVEYVEKQPTSPSWGLALRALARSRHPAVVELASTHAHDARASIAALLDVGVCIPQAMRSSAPTSPVDSAYPPPRADSLL
jgi:hypothetical protein